MRNNQSNKYMLLVIIIKLVVVGVAISFYLYALTKNIVLASIFVVATLLIYYYSMIYLKGKNIKEQYQYKQLQLYVMTMVYHLGRGHNVLNALNSSKQNLDKEITIDIENTMHELQNQVRLDTSSFNKYKFDSLDIFHHLLKIKYEKGGNAKKIFKNITRYINEEIEQREKLNTQYGTIRFMLLLMLLGAVSIPLFFIIRAPHLYEDFMSVGHMANVISLAFYSSLLIILYFIGKISFNINLNK